MSILGKSWSLAYERKPNESLWTALLKARKIENPGEFFSNATIEDLHDPFLFEAMEKAVDRLQKAIHGRERVVVYGDYDVDGLSGTALLIHTLRLLGAEVSYRIPNRQEEGYGLHQKHIKNLAAEKVSLLITVDLGISCADEIKLAQSLGIDVILTDHHTIPSQVPEAFATLHPLLSSTYPFHDLSGSGMAFKLASALLKKIKKEDFIPLLTDLASLGTVADCVPLLGENRTLVKLGLQQMKQTKWDGLRSILKNAGAWDGEFSSRTIGFQIGPRLNASGRLESPYWSLQTLLSEGNSALEKSAKLEELNRERQRMTETILLEAESTLDFNQNILLAAGPWYSGLVGLVAGRLQEKYGKPTFIMEDRGDFLVGSARGFSGYHLVEALRSAESLLEKFGGHEQAAGFHLKKEHLPAFKERLHLHAAGFFKEMSLKPSLNIDLSLLPEDLTLETCEKIQSFAPFGAGNEAPLFLMKECEIQTTRPVGQERKHIKLEGKFAGKTFEGIAFHFASHEDALRSAPNLVVQLEKNEWNGQTQVQVNLVDFSL